MKHKLLAGVALGAAIALSGAAHAQVKLGIGGPITGGAAAFGAQLKMGAEQAVEDINAAGGVLGKKLSSTTGDDASDPKQGISVANKFVGDGVTCDYAGCAAEPCFPGVDCFDEVDAFYCGPCPDGMDGDGVSCASSHSAICFIRAWCCLFSGNTCCVSACRCASDSASISAIWAFSLSTLASCRL